MPNLFDDYFLDHVKSNPENQFEYTVTKPLKVFKRVNLARYRRAVASLLIPVGAKINVPNVHKQRLRYKALGVHNEAISLTVVRMTGWAKLRTDKADVVAISDGTKKFRKARAQHDSDFVYQVGTGVRPMDRIGRIARMQCNGNECSPGIHFFLTVDEARHYG